MEPVNTTWFPRLPRDDGDETGSGGSRSREAMGRSGGSDAFASRGGGQRRALGYGGIRVNVKGLADSTPRGMGHIANRLRLGQRDRDRCLPNARSGPFQEHISISPRAAALFPQRKLSAAASLGAPVLRHLENSRNADRKLVAPFSWRWRRRGLAFWPTSADRRRVGLQSFA